MKELSIIAFCCSRGLADLEEVVDCEAKLGVKIRLLPCSSKIEVAHLLSTFESGLDGVIVAGCPEGECQFVDGNLLAGGRVAYLKKMLAEIGLEEERLRMHHLNPAKKGDLSEVLADFLNKIKEMGQSPLLTEHKAQNPDDREI
ncbi:MAG: hydrogenase iron-sulfur subunit [bacterium]